MRPGLSLSLGFMPPDGADEPPVPVAPGEPLVSEPLVPAVPADEPGVGVDEPGVGVDDEPVPLGLFVEGAAAPDGAPLEPGLGLPLVEPPAVESLPEPAWATVRR